MNEQLNKLNEILIKLENDMNFPHDRIQIFISDEHFAIEIDGEDWCNYLDFYEAYAELTTLFRGIALGKGNEWRYSQ